MTDITGIASSALSAYGRKQAVTASNVSRLNTTDSASSSVVMQTVKGGGVSASVMQGSDTVDISKEAAEMISTSGAYRANLKVLSASDEMTRELLKIKA